MSSIVVNGKTYIQTKAKRIDWIEVGQVLGACALIFLWLAYNAEKSVTSAFNFEGIPSDGPFQLYNPLRRIAAGQTGGVDFQYFHGIGIPYLHYPLYWLFGKTFVASELSRYLVTLLCSVVSLVFFAYASVPRAKKTLYFIAFAVCAFSLTDFINVYWLPRVVHDYAMVNPRVSLMGVRAAFPILVFAVFVSKIRPSIKPFILGFSLALSFFFGIDHGTAVIGGFVAISALAIGQSLEGLDRITAIVRAMKEFAHPDSAQHNYADLNHALATTLTVARTEYKYHAEIDTRFGELPQVNCNVGELNQVFLNLIVNAAHALAESGKDSSTGRITIVTAAAGDQVTISITDNGCGIPQENLDKVFDPFFTTKPVGRGTGQGLAIARSIVAEKHGGRIEVHSVVGTGTTFTLHLPVGGHSASGAQ